MSYILDCAHKCFPKGFFTDSLPFKWRSAHIDVCRHFFPISTLEKYLDLLSLYGFNKLHFHISDDQGFRFPSERFPKLAEISSVRAGSDVRRGAGEVYDPTPHGGMYTKEELRALVDYAAALKIDIVPEVDLPGHTAAILAAYPELSCDGRSTAVATSFGIKDFSSHILCAGKEEVYPFIFALLDEVMEVFPSKYIHIGGDEAGKSEWRACPHCHSELKRLGLRNERELQGHMLNRVKAHVESRGRTAIIWNDGLADCTEDGFIVQHWTPPTVEGTRRTVKYAARGNKVILSPFFTLYFDYPFAITPLKKTYSYSMAIPGIPREAILGGECLMWTEWIEDEEKLFFNLLPRLYAASAVFHRANYDYRAFVASLPAHFALYEKCGLPYAKNAAKPLAPLERIATVHAFLKKDAYIELNKIKKLL